MIGHVRVVQTGHRSINGTRHHLHDIQPTVKSSSTVTRSFQNHVIGRSQPGQCKHQDYSVRNTRSQANQKQRRKVYPIAHNRPTTEDDSMHRSPSYTNSSKRWLDENGVAEEFHRQRKNKRCVPCSPLCILAVLFLAFVIGTILAVILVAVLVRPSKSISTNTCNPSCKNGGLCDSNGFCVCQYGWTGNTCETPQSALWTFDNTLRDLNGTYTGTALNSPTFNPTGITGYGSALALNGASSQCVYVSPYLNMVMMSFSWEFWVYPTMTTIGDSTFISQCSDSTSTDHCMIFMTRNNIMLFSFWNDDVNGSTIIPVNQWSHMAFVYDLNARTKTIYLNGFFEGQQTSSGSLMATTINMTFGCLGWPGTSLNFFTGSIDQIRFFSRVRNTSEILDAATLVVKFSFRTATPLLDDSSNYINGTMSGATTIANGGIVDDAIGFLSNGSYFQVTGLILIGINNRAFSLSLWIKITSVSGGGTIAHLSSNTAGTGWCIGLIGLLPTGAVQVQTFNGGGTTPVQGPVMPVGVWQHVVQTFSTTNGLSLYINGTLYGRVAAIYLASSLPDTLTFGNQLSGTACSSSFPNQQFYGSIDEVRLYSREITTAEISQLFSNP